ncbi:MAG: hypothetical protein EYC70_04625 [Planctomycetota bacterium]|nr:MAG: hypothetical protein EYC70_04625 [Planctomycetota bacterium]
MDARLESLVERCPAWLAGGGPDADVVVASRVRLARNLAARRFPHLLPVEEAREVCRQGRERLAPLFGDGAVLEIGSLSAPERELLAERSLASRDLLDAQRPTLLFFNPAETLGLMVNEEDHFRLQSLAPGLDLSAAHKAIRPLSRLISRSFDLAVHPRFGYLTACPTNAGTGLRASLLLHLPALARAKTPLQNALQTAQRSYLAVRGLHGEGSRAMGHLYQISNQRTLGTDVTEQMQAVADFGRQVAEYERKIRGVLLNEPSNRRTLGEDVQRAWRVLADSRRLTTIQALEALSTLRLAALGGADAELGLELNPSRVLWQFFQMQPGHLQARVGAELDPDARDQSRARLLREALGIPHPEGT